MFVAARPLKYLRRLRPDPLLPLHLLPLHFLDRSVLVDARVLWYLRGRLCRGRPNSEASLAVEEDAASLAVAIFLLSLFCSIDHADFCSSLLLQDRTMPSEEQDQLSTRGAAAELDACMGNQMGGYTSSYVEGTRPVSHRHEDKVPLSTG